MQSVLDALLASPGLADPAPISAAVFNSADRPTVRDIAAALDRRGIAPTLASLRSLNRVAPLLEIRALADRVVEAPSLEELHGVFGIELLLWATFTACSRYAAESKRFFSTRGYDPALLFDAYAMLAELTPCDASMACVDANYRLLKTLPNYRVDPAELSAMILCRVTPAHERRAGDSPRYSIEWEVDRGFHELGNLTWPLPDLQGAHSAGNFCHCPSAPCAMTLMFALPDGHLEPQHTVSFYASDGSTLFINQWQSPLPAAVGEREPSRRWDPRGLGWFDHKLVHLDVLAELGRSLGFTRIGLLAAENNPWTKIRQADGAPHLPMDRARRIYDRAACQAGMTRDASDGNFYRFV